MTLWVDRRASLRPATPVTHALVVGVSAYDHLPTRAQGRDPDPLKFGLFQLSSSASGAFGFAKWLRDTYHDPAAPLATIRMLLAPSAAERASDAELDRVGGRADRASVREALFAWQRDNAGNRGGRAICFVGGHGIQTSHRDATVLLQDFARDEQVLDYSVDLGRVYQGMNREDQPHIQFYFVDACRVRPEAFTAMDHLGTGVGLNTPLAGRDERAAPMYFSSSPGTLSFGLPAGGTVFSAALLDCLAGPAVDNWVGDDGAFVITNTSLQRALEERVAELARRGGETQRVTGGGNTRTCVLHRFAEPPVFPYAIQLDPDQARSLARADVWDADRELRLVADRRFDANPVSWPLPAGVHSLDVTIRPEDGRFRSRTGLALHVQPKQARPRRVSVVG